MDRRLLGLAALLLLALVLAGCTDSRGPPVSSRAVPGDAPQVNGSGPVDLTVHVREEPGGVGFADASVVVYWGEDAHDGATPAERPWTRADPKPATPEPAEILRLRTGLDGEAVAKVPEDEYVGVVASAPGRTQEWIPRLEVGSSHRTVDLPLFDASRSFTRNVTMGPAATTGGTAPAWEPASVEWAGDPETDAAYLHRLGRLTARLTWENGPRGGGDLALGLGVDTSEPDLLVDEGNETSPGEHHEEVTLAPEGIEAQGWPDEDVLHAGPGTRSAEVSPFGLETRLRIDARFSPFPPGAGYPPFASQSDGGVRDSTPVPAWLAVAGLAGAALAARRRRPGRG